MNHWYPVLSMKWIDVALALINVAVCVWRLSASVRSRRLISIVWFLILYFSVFFIPVALTSEFEFVRGFVDEHQTVRHESIHKVVLFVFVFNGILALSESMFAKLCSGVFRKSAWTMPERLANEGYIGVVYLFYWAIGGAWWALQTWSTGYREYVEGSSWGAVLFWASSPAIVLAAMRRRWAVSLVLSIPFLYFCVHLQVRSFALLSLVPLFVVGALQVLGRESRRQVSGRLLRYGIIAGTVLVSLSIYVNLYKTGTISLPDSDMPFGAAETVAMVDRFHARVGFDGLILYAWNYINPFLKLFRIPRPEIADTPNVIAGLLEGIPGNWPVYFHYPALLWSDAYISFGWAGLSLAPFWAIVIVIWEATMKRNELLLALLLPYFCWHSYMLVRGAIAVASVPVSYSLYFSLFPLALGVGRALLAKSTMVTDQHEEPGAPATSRFNILP